MTLAAVRTIAIIFLLHFSSFLYAQPANDMCANAIPVIIPANGFGIGTYFSETSDLTLTTMQPGETVPTALLQSGLSQKSVWYKFTIPTIRKVKVSLLQQGTGINAGDVGFSVYKTSQCIPSGSDVSMQLTPIPTFGNTSHECTPPGDYYIQVSAKANANGIIYISVETDHPSAAYDMPAQAYDFGSLTAGLKSAEYQVKCQSIEDINEVCSSLGDPLKFKKSTWHVFTTPAYFDYIGLLVARETWITSNNKFGYKIYKGDVRTSNYATLPVAIGCDSLENQYTYSANKVFACGTLETNTTYSLQLFSADDFEDIIRVALSTVGTNPTQAPQPTLSAISSPSNALGILPSNASGLVTTVTDYLACNSRHANYSCENTMPANGLVSTVNNYRYNLSSFFTFTISTTSEVSFSASLPGSCSSPPLLLRLYKQNVTNACTDLSTSNLVALTTSPYYWIPPYKRCMEPGTYVLQVMGTDSTSHANTYSYGWLYNNSNPICLKNNLGQKFSVGINVKELVNQSKFSLSSPGAFDSINAVNGVLAPLVHYTNYISKIDTFGCANTVLPWDTACVTGNQKAIYRQFSVNDSVVLSVTGTTHLSWKLYGGDANNLALSQNVSSFPDRIQQLDPITKCLTYGDCRGTQVCLAPGTYTQVTFGADENISLTSQPSFMVKPSVTTYNSPQNAENMGDILSLAGPGGSVSSSTDYFSCKDNAIPINGYSPCTFNGQTGTKAIYREFYLSEPSSINISNYNSNPDCHWWYNTGNGLFTVFSGRISDGIAGVQVLSSAWRCTQSINNASNCNILPAGWYTVVSYGIGPTFSNPLNNVQQSYAGYSSHVSWGDKITITINPQCPGPKYNRPHKAAIDTSTNEPFLIKWGPRLGHTSAYPKTDTSYTLYTTYFNCTNDTPFVNISTPSCGSNFTKVSYYVFKTVQESYVRVNTQGFMGAIYQGDARTDSASFLTSPPIQTCLPTSGQIQICKMQPGTYTLIIYGYDYQNCNNMHPVFFVDQVGYSRFDHAANAYDFGTIPPDSVFHYGKAGDVNPIDPGRAASSDIFYCTTGAGQYDVSSGVCNTDYKPEIYNPQLNNAIYTNGAWGVPRRNLWYSFVVENGGNVRVKVESKTPGRQVPYNFTVYKSDVDGSQPFSTIASNGWIDSTTAQGLIPVVNSNGCYYPGLTETTFYRSTCSSLPERYYVVIDIPNTTYMWMYGYNPYVMDPNHQVDVSILMDSVNTIKPLFDHYANPGIIGTNLGEGTHIGPTDNYSCATKSGNEPTNYTYCADKTLWYKFTSSVTGKIRYRVKVNNSYFNYEHIILYKEKIPGDSTSIGLLNVNPSNFTIYDNTTASSWNSTCITPGTYYLLLTGCYRVDEYATPEIKIIEEKGDFCSAPMVATLNGPGTSITPVIIDCHTIGTDYGEFNPTLSCPPGAPKENYKTSWFRLDITGPDTLDVTTYLTENTTATSSQIKYRMMDGNCGAMQERSCVQDALTQDTYKCLLPGKSYFFQVFTPISATGSINLNLSAVVHSDTCATEKNCLSTAVFIPQFDCTTSDSVRFTNLSTYGAGIQYEWDFGYNNLTSTAVSPVMAYPSLATAATYTIKLKVTNTGCSLGSLNVDSMSTSITMPGRPNVSLGNDTTVCNFGGNLLLNATTWPGATYQWNTGATTPTMQATYGNVNDYWVKVDYNGCVKRDTIRVGINPITKIVQQKILCGNDSSLLNSNRGYPVSYLWNTGSSSSQVHAPVAGSYTNQINWNGCITTDSFTVINASEPFLSRDTMICYPFQNFTLNVSTPQASSYSWQNGAGGSTYTVTQPGTYSVSIYNGHCYKRDTILVMAADPVIIQQSAASVCEGTSYLLPWGNSVSSSGVYTDTIKYSTGCDSLIRKVDLKVTSVNSLHTTTSICAGQTYMLPWGGIVSEAGMYRDTVRNFSGCDSLIRSVNLSIATASFETTYESLCAGQTFLLPWGQTVSSTGIYKDTLHYLAGCDSLVRTFNIEVLPTFQSSSGATICSGQTYVLPWGPVVNTAGTYYDTTQYLNGCDSLIKSFLLTVNPPLSQYEQASICEGQSYILPWGLSVNTSGIYRDTISYVSGCDSLVRSVDLHVNPLSTSTNSVSICQGSSYVLPWGQTVSATGIYKDTLHYLAGCDSLVRTFNIEVLPTFQSSSGATICSGQTYVLPWGPVVNTAGTYYDTTQYLNGCDSLIRSFVLTVNPPLSQHAEASICEGQSYILPWGLSVNSTGIYRDTISYVSGCDSLVRSVDLHVNPLSTSTNSVSICQGSSYVLPWGQTVSATGIYKDTLHYLAGCDSLVRTFNIEVLPTLQSSSGATICSGQTYVLPWGPVVNTAGMYYDTIHYLTGCDSLIRSFELMVNPPLSQHTEASICEGQTYILPWGSIVITTGIYRDTISYLSGCDSLVRSVNLLVNPLMTTSNAASICEGSSYILPWGQTVSSTGIYKDTLHYLSGCDSLIRTFYVEAKAVTLENQAATICSGQSYILPWGPTVSTQGIYHDTLHYATGGCDSIRRSFTVVVNEVQNMQIAASVCEGETYMLPWGIAVNAAGVYLDTLHYSSGCDSLIREATVTVRNVVNQSQNVTICNNQAYLLPWGQWVSSSGVYKDTLHYLAGCDSIIKTFHVEVLPTLQTTSGATICSGQSYMLPWGTPVNTTGIYHDTLHYLNGCDSLIRSFELTVQHFNTISTTVPICEGSSYLLPWGTTVYNAGMYNDTLRYSSGCDSLRRSVTVTVKPKTVQINTITICQGQNFVLPWGSSVSNAGTYKDTLHYISGCDSLIRIINLDVKPLSIQNTSATTCSGVPFVLPWGTAATTSGTYRDTLRYTGGCDSLIRIVQLNVTAPQSITTNATICSDQQYNLSWGPTVNSAGIYNDTLKTAFGCDSLIRRVDLRVNPVPEVVMNKTNDIDCVLGTARISATGGTKYEWSPAGSLNNPFARDPIAYPVNSTMYYVKVTGANNCIKTDSILVNVNIRPDAEGYYVPSAFTPNGDGKNDCFGVRTWGAVTDLKISIFNRWGELVFSTTNPQQCWDGTYKGKAQGSEVFVYVISAKTICGPVTRKGTVTVVR